MENKRDELLEEAMRVESNMAKLYMLYGQYFDEDKEFWKGLAEEEEKHASLIRLGKDVLTENILSKIFLYDNLDELKASNKEIEGILERYGKETPSKQEAYDLAIELEEKIYEDFYQQKMADSPDSSQMGILQKLNNDSKDHAKRIKELRK